MGWYSATSVKKDFTIFYEDEYGDMELGYSGNSWSELLIEASSEFSTAIIDGETFVTYINFDETEYYLMYNGEKVSITSEIVENGIYTCGEMIA